MSNKALLALSGLNTSQKNYRQATLALQGLLETLSKELGDTAPVNPLQQLVQLQCAKPQLPSIARAVEDFARTGRALTADEEATLKRPVQEALHPLVLRSPFARRSFEDSVYNLAKRKPETVVAEYDLVICAGLFDYLTDRFCRRVMEVGVASLRPGGTLLVTIVSRCSDSFFMERLLEWDLIYRTSDHLESLLPRGESLSHKVYADATSTNVMAEIVLAANAAPAV